MRRLKTLRRLPIYPKTPGHLPCSSLTHPLPLPSRRPSVSFGGFGFSITNMGGSATGTYTFSVPLDANGQATRDFTVVATRAQLQALRLSSGPQVVSLSVDPIFGSRIQDIFKFTGPDRLSVTDDPRLFVLPGLGLVTTWFNDYGNAIPDRLRGTVDVGDARHPVLVPGFGYIVTVAPLDPNFQLIDELIDTMLLIPGEPITDHTRGSP